MRNLTIKRLSSWAGKLGKIKIYIEDPANPQLKINNVPCRVLGTLKDGEEKTFEIPTEPVRIFAIPGKMTKGLSNDYIHIGPGEEDYFVTGRVRFLRNGFASFYFDGDVGSESRANRDKVVKRGWIVNVCGFVIGFALAFGLAFGLGNTGKTFSEDGLSINLPYGFYEQNQLFYTACYASDDAVVITLKEPFYSIKGAGYSPESMTPSDYARIVKNNNNLSTPIQTKDGLSYFEWTAKHPSQNVDFSYMGVAFKSDDAFWLVQFGTYSYLYDGYKDDFFKWAKSVEFE